MSDHVYKKIELVGTSTKSVEDAIQQAINAACKTLEHVNWFEVQEVRGDVKTARLSIIRPWLK